MTLRDLVGMRVLSRILYIGGSLFLLPLVNDLLLFCYSKVLVLYKHSRESIPVLPFSLWGYIATKLLRESLVCFRMFCFEYRDLFFFLSLVILSLTSHEHGTLENKTANCGGINFEIFCYNVPLLQWSRENIPVLDRGSIYLFVI